MHTRYYGLKFDARRCRSFDNVCVALKNSGFKGVVQDARSRLLVLEGVDGVDQMFSFYLRLPVNFQISTID